MQANEKDPDPVIQMFRLNPDPTLKKNLTRIQALSKTLFRIRNSGSVAEFPGISLILNSLYLEMNRISQKNNLQMCISYIFFIGASTVQPTKILNFFNFFKFSLNFYILISFIYCESFENIVTILNGRDFLIGEYLLDTHNLGHFKLPPSLNSLQLLSIEITTI